MRYIECKAQWLSRPLTTKTAISGFEGPAARTEVDDGFGIPTVKGMLTPSYNCYFEETGRVDNSPIYDGTFNVPDTKANRYKLACSIRVREIRVKDRNLEREILGQFPPSLTREQAPKPRGIIFDMPEDFDGSKVVLRAGNAAIVDADPIEDPFQAVEGEFTEVSKPSPVLAGDAGAAAAAIAAEESDVQLSAPKVSVAQAAAGQVAKPATEPAKGFDAKSVRERAAAAAAEAKAAAKPAETPKADEAVKE